LINNHLGSFCPAPAGDGFHPRNLPSVCPALYLATRTHMTKPVKEPLIALKFTAAELAQAFAHDSRTLRRRMGAAGYGAPPWSVGDVYKALTRGGSMEALRTSKTLLTEAQRNLAELELAQRRGELVEGSDTERCWGEVCVTVRQQMEALVGQNVLTHAIGVSILAKFESALQRVSDARKVEEEAL